MSRIFTPMFSPAAAASSSAQSASHEISNLAIATSVGASALTIALKQADGSTDPGSGTAAVTVGMRSVTLTSGLYNQRTVTGALSLVISSGSTMGQTSAKPAVIYVYLLDNAGTLELAASGTFFHENQVVSSTTEGGAGAADLNNILYSTTGRSNVPCRLVGKITNTQTTAGTWASAGTVLQVGDLAALSTFTGPTVQTFTSGTGTYFTPAGVKYLKIRAIGGGGGGGGSGTAAGGTGGTGGVTTFGTSTVTGNGGVGGAGAGGAQTVGGAGGTASLAGGAIGTALSGSIGSGAIEQVVITTCVVGGMPGASSPFGGGGGGGFTAAGSAPAANTGAGGGAAGMNNNTAAFCGSSGGAGGFCDCYIVSPLTTYAYGVGAAGAAGGAGTNGNAGGAGGAGYIEVTEFYS